MLIMNIALGPKIINSGKSGSKIEMFSNFHQICHSGQFKIFFNKVTNLMKELRNVKTLKNFYSRGVLLPSQTSSKEIFEENMFNQLLNAPLYFEM